MTYDRCPKCAHAPLPVNQSAPAACPACGVILAKVTAIGMAKIAARDAPLVADLETEPRTGLFEVFFHVPQALDRMYWALRTVAFVSVTLWTIWILQSVDIAAGEAGSFFLWAVLTPFHEAGHVLLMWAPQFVTILGGTLGQWLMPAGLAGMLLIQRRDPFGAALFTWLLGYSFIMTAVYMFDAFDPKIMLLDGRTGAESDGHDWQNMFGDLGLLPRARGIGSFFGWLGQALMLAAIAWAAAIVWLQRARVSDNPFAEDGVDG